MVSEPQRIRALEIKVGRIEEHNEIVKSGIEGIKKPQAETF